MSVYKNILISLLFMLTHFSFAAANEVLTNNASTQGNPTDTISAKSDVKISDIKVSSVISKDSSEYNRIGKKISAAYTSGYMDSFALNGYGVHYFLDQNSQIEASYLTGRRDLFFESLPERIMYGSQEAKMTLLSAGYKRYLGNSFYIKSLASLRKVNFDKNFSGLLFLGESVGNYSFEGETVNLSLTIGNQWQWDYFTLGFDWIGYAFPIASRIKRDQGSGEITTDPYYENYRKSVKKSFTKDSWVSAIVLSLGATF